MNKIIGFFGSYVDGFDPSRIPPCGVARIPEVAAAAAAAVLETAEVMVLDMVCVLVCMGGCRLSVSQGSFASCRISLCGLPAVSLLPLSSLCVSLLFV